MLDFTRRSLLVGLGAAGLSRWSLAAAPTPRRLVVCLLRGAMDGLSAVPAHGDPDYAKARGSAAIPPPGTPDGALDLDGTFGLHPALAAWMPRWNAGELAIVHAAALPYGARSHFDAQNVLETGAATPRARDDGWLSRAVAAMDPGGGPALAVGSSVPLILRGAADVTSVDPLREVRPEDDTMSAISALYARDKLLGPALDNALRTQETLASMGEDALAAPARASDVRRAADAVGRWMARPDGPAVAVFELSGWDTHVTEPTRLPRQLATLADGIDALAGALGDTWSDTVVLAVSEFGRTVRANGTGGTDHGYGSAMFLLGGAVAGGQVVGDWPGLSAGALFEGRDLAATTDFRDVFAGVLRDQLGLDARALANVFPGAALRPVDGLVRA